MKSGSEMITTIGCGLQVNCAYLLQYSQTSKHLVVPMLSAQHSLLYQSHPDVCTTYLFISAFVFNAPAYTPGVLVDLRAARDAATLAEPVEELRAPPLPHISMASTVYTYL